MTLRHAWAVRVALFPRKFGFHRKRNWAQLKEFSESMDMPSCAWLKRPSNHHRDGNTPGQFAPPPENPLLQMGPGCASEPKHFRRSPEIAISSTNQIFILVR
jgi:hypothetical protein